MFIDFKPLYFKPSHHNFNTSNHNCRHLHFTQKIRPLTERIFSELLEMPFRTKFEIALINGAVLLSIIGSDIFYDWLKNESEQEEYCNNDFNFYNFGIQIAGVSIISSIPIFLPIGYRLLNITKYSSGVYAQKLNILTQHLEIVLTELINENPDIINLWSKVKNFSCKTEMNAYLINRIKEGACYGYVMAILEQIQESGHLHGDELIKNININTVLKKQITSVLHYDFGKFLKANTQEEHVVDGILVISFNPPSKNLTLDNGETIQLSEITDAHKKSCRLMLHTKGAERINTDFPMTLVADGADEIERRFINHITRNSFIPIDKIDPNNFSKSVIDFIDDSSFKQQEEPFVVNIFKFMNIRRQKKEFLNSQSNPFPSNTIFAGEILLADEKDLSHSLYFRHSNGKYHLFDPNFAFFELATSKDFYQKLYNHINKCYGLEGTMLKFHIRAIFPIEKV